MPELRVGLDCAARRQTAAGTARVLDSLAAALRARGDVEVVELGGGALLPRGSWRQRLDAVRQDLVWFPWRARRAALASRCDVYHAPLPRGPLRRGRPATVVTLHDLAVFREPETLGRWNRYYTRATIRRVVRAADRIVCVSDDTARDARTLLGLPAAKVRVVPNGVSPHLFGTAPALPPGVPRRYALFVGTREPRKNLARLAQATASAGIPLVVVGDQGWGATAPLMGEVHDLGRVDDGTLHALYARAICLAIPSLHEGFGLTALEAMAAGCPVVAADRGALPEVCAGAAVLVDPLDLQAIADGIHRAERERDELIARGRRRASAFSWECSAAALVAVYREAAGQSSGWSPRSPRS